MDLGDVCHGPRCSLTGLGAAALGYRPCCWPGGSAGSPQCARPMGCWFFPVPRPPYVCTCVRCPGPLGSCSPVCPLGALLCLCGVLGHLAPVHRCGRSVRCFACAVSWATWLLFTSVPARCVALRVRCPGPLGSCSTVCLLGALPVCAVSWATWLLFAGVPPRRVVLLVRCPGPLGSCSPMCPLRVLFCLCGVLGHLAPVHRCVRSVRCLCVRCPGPLCSCSPVCPLVVLCCVCGVLGLLAPFHRCASLVRCFACAVSWAPWLLFTGVPARRVVLRVRCPGPPGSCSQVCLLGALFCLCGVLGPLAPVHRCARSACSVACAVCWGIWLLFTSLPGRRVVLRVRCPWPLGSCFFGAWGLPPGEHNTKAA